METKTLVMLGAGVGGTAGGGIGALFDGGLGLWSVLLSTIGGLAGIYIAYKLNQR